MRQDIWLISQLTQRDFMQRYKGTFLGVLWPVLYSLLFLSVFTYVFTVVLSVRWGSSSGNGALMIFCGLVPHLFISEVVGRSPMVILGAANFVKKVRFPIEFLPVVAVNSAFIICLINVALLMLFGFATGQATALSVPIMIMLLIPLYLFVISVSWIMSALGVYFRDISQIAPVVVQLMMFMAPVFYPMSNIPETIRHIFYINPLTYFVEAFREALSGVFDWKIWLIVTVLYGILALVSSFVFRRLRPAFGDLL